jgi:altronate dehydratase
VPDGDPRFGFANINDNAEIAELIACGSQVILFSTGRGSVVGSAISPVIKVCANPETFKRMEEDMDVDAGRILEGRARCRKWVARSTIWCIAWATARRPSRKRSAIRNSSSPTRASSPRALLPAALTNDHVD